MSDANLEAKLTKYRPVGPDAGLRDRVVNVDSRQPRAGWMSIAALFFIIVVLHMLAAGERASVRVRLEDPARQEMLIRELAEQLGGDEFALLTARALIEMSATAGDVE